MTLKADVCGTVVGCVRSGRRKWVEGSGEDVKSCLKKKKSSITEIIRCTVKAHLSVHNFSLDRALSVRKYNNVAFSSWQVNLINIIDIGRCVFYGLFTRIATRLVCLKREKKYCLQISNQVEATKGYTEKF